MIPRTLDRLGELLDLFVLAACVGLLCVRCAPASPDYATPRYGIEVRSEVPVDLDALDTAWELALSCWQHRLSRTLATPPPRVEIITRGLRTSPRSGCLVFVVGADSVTGSFGSREIWLAPDLCAAQHEFSHWIEVEATGWTDGVATACG